MCDLFLTNQSLLVQKGKSIPGINQRARQYRSSELESYCSEKTSNLMEDPTVEKGRHNSNWERSA